MNNRSGQWGLRLFFLVGIFLSLVLSRSSAFAAHEGDLAARKILVVMSYHEGYPWQQEIREGIEAVLGGANLTFFDLDTKLHPKGGGARAEEVFELYQKLRPDAVISADDNAQSLFVVPHLRDKVETPVVFCGVNKDPESYGFPASNVTGVLEKTHIRQSLTFARLIDPRIRRVGVIYTKDPSSRVQADQMRNEMGGYSVEVTSFSEVATFAEATGALDAMHSKADAVLSLVFTGLLDEQGNPMEMSDFLPRLERHWGKPIIGTTDYHVQFGALCAVAKSGREQGTMAGEIVREVLRGRALSSFPITQNRTGRRMINVSTARRLNITLDPTAIVGSELIR